MCKNQTSKSPNLPISETQKQKQMAEETNTMALEQSKKKQGKEKKLETFLQQQAERTKAFKDAEPTFAAKLQDPKPFVLVGINEAEDAVVVNPILGSFKTLHDAIAFAKMVQAFGAVQFEDEAVQRCMLEQFKPRYTPSALRAAKRCPELATEGMVIHFVHGFSSVQNVANSIDSSSMWRKASCTKDESLFDGWTICCNPERLLLNFDRVLHAADTEAEAAESSESHKRKRTQSES